MPPESCLGKWFSKPRRPDLGDEEVAASPLLGLAHAALAQAEADVLRDVSQGNSV